MNNSIDITEIASEICQTTSLILGERVGVGAFKETFRVTDNSGKAYALKIFKSGDFNIRSQREIEAMLRCNHPQIAKILNISAHHKDSNEYPYLLEEFFAGGTLGHHITTNGQLTSDEAIDLGSKLIDAISHIASLNLVHRDIKPENILFREVLTEPIITDFGIVRDLDATSATETWFPSGPGTPYFAAPEQLTNEKTLIDWRTDQFSLGVTLSLCTLGIHPFYRPGLSDNDLIASVASKQNPSDLFIESAEKAGLVFLPKMVSAWPIQRFLTPDLLLQAWNEQRRE